jgi:zinc protease
MSVAVHMKRLSLIGVLLALAATLGAQAPDRTKPPASGPAPALKFPAIEERRLSNGVPVWIVELHKVPVVQVSLVVLSGSADDPSGKYGVASLAAAMLEQGAGGKSALELADAIDFLGADVSAVGGIDSTSVRLHVPVARLGQALPLMADVALRPDFPPDELERLRQERVTTLLQARDDPATIGALAFSRVLYGSAHRFGTATMGTAATIRTLSPGDLRTSYAAAFRPDKAGLIAVGDVTVSSLMPLLEANFGTWKPAGPEAARRPLPPPPVRTRREIYLVDKPGAPQSQIRIGSIGVARSTPDYFPIQVMNTILGGSFSSRLNFNLRETHGYTYGASSSFDMRAVAGPFAASAGVQTDKTSEALKEFFNELNGILKPVPADELAREKHYVALRFPGAFETTGGIARRLEEMLVYRLPHDSFSTYTGRIEAVTAADAERVARKYIQPDRLAVVVVGDRKAIEPGIRSLNLGPINIVTIDEIFGP